MIRSEKSPCDDSKIDRETFGSPDQFNHGPDAMDLSMADISYEHHDSSKLPKFLALK